jgi:molybdate transport system permease protein
MDILPIIISLKTASLAILITFFTGLFAAWMVYSLRNELVKSILDGILILPLVLPPTVAGFMLLYVFGVRRPVGKFFLDYFSIKIAFSWGAAVLAAVVMSFPLMYRSARSALEQIDPNLVHAARTLGMSEWKIFWKVMLPVSAPGIIGGGILAFARGLGEFGATAMIAGNIAGQTRTIPLAVYSAVSAGDMETAGGYVILILILSFFIIVSMNYAVSSKHYRRKSG